MRKMMPEMNANVLVPGLFLRSWSATLSISLGKKSDIY
jgi:hypothetical protein